MSHFEGSRDWGRLLTAMLTPFTSDGEVDFAEAAKIAAFLVDQQGNDGIVVNGTTGESPTLSESEKLRLLEVVLETVGDRAAVIFGAGSNDTAESIQMTRAGTWLGAHGIMLVNPYYNRPGQAGLYAHFSTVAAETDLPVMLYNIQPRAAINLETDTLMRLAEIKNIVAVKEASGNIGQIGDVCRLAPAGFRIYSGDDGLTLPILSVGGYGLVSVVAHVVGTELAELIAVFPHRPDRAREIHHKLTPVFRALFSAPSPVPIKYALSLLGYGSERVRLPLVELTDDEKQPILRVLHSVGKVQAALV
jgi:4-hydroxy-tetrahydrodipicolinate synthase